jgi:hypothetical protein
MRALAASASAHTPNVMERTVASASVSASSSDGTARCSSELALGGLALLSGEDDMLLREGLAAARIVVLELQEDKEGVCCLAESAT